MVDTTIASTDVTVLGGPSSIVLDVNFGPEGNRGTYIYSVLGKPGDPGVSIPDGVQIYDIAINILNTSTTSKPSEDYLNMYQYISGADGNPEWIRLLSFQSLVTGAPVSLNFVVPFTTGSSTEMKVPLYGYTSLANLDLNVQCSIESDKAVALSFSRRVEFIEAENQYSLFITANATERSGTGWTNLDGVTRTVHVSVVVIPSTSVIS